MKNRTLLVLCLMFGALFFGRTLAISSEVMNAQTAHDSDAGMGTDKDKDTDSGTVSKQHEAGHDEHETAMGDKNVGDNNMAENNTAHNEADGPCLSGAVYEIVAQDKARNKALAAKLNEREAALKALESTLKIQLAGIEKTNAQLDIKIEKMQSIATEDISHLVKMYETMKPKQASEIFDSMDPAFAAGFLRKMKSETAGLIMANMNPRKSYAISLIIAGKNASYRKPL